MLARNTTRLVPPADTKGSGTPVTGSAPNTCPRFTVAWMQMSAVTPVASNRRWMSFAFKAMRKPAIAMTTNAAISTNRPMRPSSSPMIAPIMSVCASGR